MVHDTLQQMNSPTVFALPVTDASPGYTAWVRASVGLSFEDEAVEPDAPARHTDDTAADAASHSSLPDRRPKP